MKWWAHVLCSALLAVALAPGEVASAPVLVAVGAVLPDVLERILGVRHRSLHELAVYLLLTGPLALAGTATLALGAVDHILTDALTVHGVTVFGFRVRGPLKTDSYAHNALAVAIHLLPLALIP